MNDVPEQNPMEGVDAESFRDRVGNLAIVNGWVGVEFSFCPKCNTPNWHFHRAECEAVHCLNDECKQRYESKMPRPPQPGDETAEQYREVISRLHDTYVEALRKEGATVPVQADLDALPEGTRKLIGAIVIASQRDTLLKVVAVVEQLADLAKRGHGR